MDVDTAQIGKPALRFNGYARALYTVPVCEHLAPGEGYTFPCTAPLPSTDAGPLTFTDGPISISGPIARDDG